MSTPSRPLPPKKEVALALLQGPSLFIHLDPRRPEVVVPTYFKKQPQLVLQVGMNMAIAIPDLKVDDEGVTCTLSFNRRPFWCRLPWTAIYALVGEDMKGMIWPDEVPSEVAAQRENKGPQPVAPAPGSAPGKPRARPPREPRKKLGLAGPESSGARDDGDVNEPAEVSPPVPVHSVESVSAGPPSSGRSPARPAAPGASPSPAPAASPLKRDSSSKPGKRELPPYLRVVK